MHLLNNERSSNCRPLTYKLTYLNARMKVQFQRGSCNFFTALLLLYPNVFGHYSHNMKELTKRQKEVLGFICSFQEEHGRPPLAPEIADHFGFSHHSSAYEHLRTLERKDYLKIQQTGKRRVLRIQLTSKAQQLVAPGYPLLGEIPAGPLSDIFNDDTDQVNAVEDLIPGIQPGDFFVRVEGESMIKADLAPGDLVAFRPKQEVRNGDICAVWVDGEGSTMKYVYYEGNGTIKLVPDNPDRQTYPVMVHPTEKVRIQGVLIASVQVRQH